MPDKAQTASLHRDVKILSGMLLRKGYFDEANWLWMAFASPASCHSPTAREHLWRAAQVAEEQRLGAVSNWLKQRF